MIGRSTWVSCDGFAEPGRPCSEKFTVTGGNTKGVRYQAITCAGWRHVGGLDFCPIHGTLTRPPIPSRFHRPLAEQQAAFNEVDDEWTIDRCCEVMHDAYEAAAVQAGWATQQRSRVPWSQVPEPNKQTMRAAVIALIDHLEAGTVTE